MKDFLEKIKALALKFKDAAYLIAVVLPVMLVGLLLFMLREWWRRGSTESTLQPEQPNVTREVLDQEKQARDREQTIKREGEKTEAKIEQDRQEQSNNIDKETEEVIRQWERMARESKPEELKQELLRELDQWTTNKTKD